MREMLVEEVGEVRGSRGNYGRESIGSRRGREGMRSK